MKDWWLFAWINPIPMVGTEATTRYSFESYMALAELLVAEGRTSGPDQSAMMIEFTHLNLHRMRRVSKTMVVLPETQAAFAKVEKHYRWILIAEPWCGDAAQIVPGIAAVAALSPNIQLEILLRDGNLDLIDQHLTNGGRAIPKLLVEDVASGEIVAEWGPRPKAAQDMVKAYKAMEPRPSYEEFVVEIQKWYGQDKTVTLQQELAELMKGR